MGKIAFIYPGQGSQKVGLGQDILTSRPDIFAHYLGRCDELAGAPVSQYCLEGPHEALNRTSIAQPAIFAHSLALTAYAYQLGLAPDFVAGHSLGEYTAAVAAGVLSFAEGVYLVTTRAQLSHEVQVQQPGAMAAVIGMDADLLGTLCAEVAQTHLVVVANWNAPTQCVISGTEAGIQEMTRQLRALPSPPKVLRLPIGGAFHSPLMRPMEAALGQVMQTLSWHDAQVPLTENVSGCLLRTADQIRRALLDQICGSVYWTTSVKTLIAAGCDTFVEIGSGSVLTKLVRLIAPEVVTYSADTLAKLEAFASQQHTSLAYAA